MATVYLHIGLPKTGTTAIQNFLKDNRAVLKEHGICYPNLGVKYPYVSPLRNAHFLASSLKNLPDGSCEISFSQKYESLLGQIAELGKTYDKIILTDELLWRRTAYQTAFWEKLKSDLADNGLSLRVIAYLRRQDSFTLSLYRQKVKAHITDLSFDEFFETQMKTYPLDYYSYFNALSGVISRENLIIRVYEKEQYRGEEHTLFSDFLDIFGLTMKDGFTISTQEINLSMDGTRLELRRILNALPRKKARGNALAQSFKNIGAYNLCSKSSSENTSFFRPGEQSAFLESFAESNSRLAREYLGREDGVLFQNTQNIELPEYHVNVEELLQESILLYATAVEYLDEKDTIKYKEFVSHENLFRKKLKESLKKELKKEIKAELKEELKKEMRKELKPDFEKIRSDLRDVRENVVLYRLKRKMHHLSDKNSSK